MTLKKNIQEIGKRVIELEASALSKQASDMPRDFSRTIEAVLKTKGRVIVCGVGKSGHVGRKIAATLASTGTPASFVHATEASHGDLGMITPDDFCLLISFKRNRINNFLCVFNNSFIFYTMTQILI